MRQRLFTNEYSIGDAVAIIRERHGWHDGHTHGKISKIDSHTAIVAVGEGKDYTTYEIKHPRDIRKI